VILAGRIQAMVQDHGDPVVTPKWGGLDGLKMLGMIVSDFFHGVLNRFLILLI